MNDVISIYRIDLIFGKIKNFIFKKFLIGKKYNYSDNKKLKK